MRLRFNLDREQLRQTLASESSEQEQADTCTCTQRQRNCNTVTIHNKHGKRHRSPLGDASHTLGKDSTGPLNYIPNPKSSLLFYCYKSNTKIYSWVWWPMPGTTAFMRLRQEAHEAVRGPPGLHSGKVGEEVHSCKSTLNSSTFYFIWKTICL